METLLIADSPSDWFLYILSHFFVINDVFESFEVHQSMVRASDGARGVGGGASPMEQHIVHQDVVDLPRGEVSTVPRVKSPRFLRLVHESGSREEIPRNDVLVKIPGFPIVTADIGVSMNSNMIAI